MIIIIDKPTTTTTATTTKPEPTVTVDQGNSGGTGNSYLIISTNWKLSTELFKYCV